MSELPSAQQIYDLIDATWPAVSTASDDVWTIRNGKGGGSRVSATTANTTEISRADVQRAASEMKAMGQSPLFMVREGEDSLDKLLADEGYEIKDPVNLYASDIGQLTAERPAPLTGFSVWPPLACQREIWEVGGIGPARVDVMERAESTKTTLLGRLDDTPAGTVYVGVSENIAMIHALEILPEFRRLGLAAGLTKAVAFWAKSQGARFVTLVTTKDNAGANGLYSSLGMEIAGTYHYRIQK